MLRLPVVEGRVTDREELQLLEPVRSVVLALSYMATWEIAHGTLNYLGTRAITCP